MSNFRRNLSYANVTATLALFIAIGGASAFAATELKKSSVGSHQIKKNAITTAKIKDRAVTESKIRNAAITGEKIANAAVTGSKVASGSLTGADINLSTLPMVPSANNANMVNGQAPTKIFKVLLPGETNVAVATVSGFSLNASCTSEKAAVRVTSPSSAGSVLIAEGGAGTSPATKTSSAMPPQKPVKHLRSRSTRNTSVTKKRTSASRHFRAPPLRARSSAVKSDMTSARSARKVLKGLVFGQVTAG